MPCFGGIRLGSFGIVMNDAIHEPLLEEESCISEVHTFNECNEVDDVASSAATAEAVEAILVEGDSECRGILALVNRTGSRQTLSVSLKGFGELVVLKDLKHADAGFHLFEVHEARGRCVVSVHRGTIWFVV